VLSVLLGLLPSSEHIIELSNSVSLSISCKAFHHQRYRDQPTNFRATLYEQHDNGELRTSEGKATPVVFNIDHEVLYGDTDLKIMQRILDKLFIKIRAYNLRTVRNSSL
jgi:hypothetical protein